MSHRRNDELTESAEMYLKEIYLLQRHGRAARTGEIARRLDVAPPSVTEMLNNLADANLVSYQKQVGARLTADGEDRARHLLRKHCLIERFLIDEIEAEIGVHEEACRLEHVLSDDLAAAFEAVVHRERDCPACYDPTEQHCEHLSVGDERVDVS